MRLPGDAPAGFPVRSPAPCRFCGSVHLRLPLDSAADRHILLVPALALLMYLGMYSWNQRTHILDNFAANTGLEASGVVLKSVRMVQDTVMGAWNRYLDLVDVREENDELKKQVEQLRHRVQHAAVSVLSIPLHIALTSWHGRRSGPACSPGAWGRIPRWRPCSSGAGT